MSDQILAQFERELDKFITYEEPAGPLYHYTTAAGFVGILKSKHLHATHFRQLNDRNEIIRGEEVMQEEAVTLRDRADRESPEYYLLDRFAKEHAKHSVSKVTRVFVASLTERPDDLSQWRAYGINGKGYCLGFEKFRKPTPDVVQPQAGLMLIRCEYSEEAFRERARKGLQDIASAFAQYLRTYGTRDNAGAMQKCATILALTYAGCLIPTLKDPAFRDEAEWRFVITPTDDHEHLIEYKTNDRGIVPYYQVPLALEEGNPMPLNQVFLGPTQDPSTGAEMARLLLKHHGYDEGLIRTSTIPFRG